MATLRGKSILIGITGGIAAYKVPYLIRGLKALGADVRVILTTAAKQFVTPTTLQAISGHPIHDDLFDPTQEAAMGHIDLARWADLLLIAPATADCLARLAHGHANDLLTTVCLATEAPILLAPAMNRVMWQNPATQANIAILKARHVDVLPIGDGEQACGDIGEGRMLEPDAIIDHLLMRVSAGPLQGKKILITAGPTHEKIDPVRFISNPSTGKMGYAIAIAAASMGADVTLISGPTTLPSPKGLHTVRVTTASDMQDAVMRYVHDQDIFIAAAAVGDYRTETISTQKIKKTNSPLSITLVPNPDILKAVSALPKRPFCVGFAAETEALLKNAASKLASKNLDMICVNDVSDQTIGFGSDENALTVMTPTLESHLPKQPKHMLAKKLLQLISVESQYE
ncbi:MAG: bifunctional phosphopantothenoylcysteine decarboxylase/phosphopantothenate--cysteine ligase CoaBC [Gammaproteobacteria bacterium]